MNIFQFRNKLIEDYKSYVKSFIRIKEPRIRQFVEDNMKSGFLWPNPLIQLNPAFEPGASIDELTSNGVLDSECAKIFRRGKSKEDPVGQPLKLHKHQEEAVQLARKKRNYVLTTGTGSGKSLAYIVPIVDYVLRQGSGKGIKAIVVYPMNALANSQFGELEKFLCEGYPEGKEPVRFGRYTGQEKDEQRKAIIANPPDILLTNYVMLELILTRPEERGLIEAASDLQFLVLDELHTYRGRQGADVALLNRRVRNLLGAESMQCIGTSATLAGPGTHQEQQKEVAKLASRLFGANFEPSDIVGETLRRITPDIDFDAPSNLQQLKERVSAKVSPRNEFDAFINDPLAAWIETHFGLEREPETGKLKRTSPKSIEDNGDKLGAASALSQQIGVSVDTCKPLIQETLFKGYHVRNPDTDFPVFAFRLHQFISRGDCVYASLEKEDQRHLTLHKQTFVPDGTRERKLLPLVFNREGGQEYYCVRRKKDPSTGDSYFEARDIGDRNDGDHDTSGFLYLSSTNPWPERGSQEEMDRLPEDWLERHNGVIRVRKDRRKYLPEHIRIAPDGNSSPSGIKCVFIPAPFRFCLDCGISYSFQTRTDFGKLSSLGSEGRSTATTILSLSAILSLRKEQDIDKEAKKLLSFTDNRQDASLQAGHFNDFVEVSMIRGAIYQAAKSRGENGLLHHELTQKVFEHLDLGRPLYAADPEIKFQGAKETDQALRDVLGYRIYHDLKRGWRVTSPNLEQCGLLEIEYSSLDELCESQEDWAVWDNQGTQHPTHPALQVATPEERLNICRVLLNFMRRSLAISVDYLDDTYQQQLKQKSSQRLANPWAIDENERLEHAATAIPRSKREKESMENVYVSARGGYGRYLRKPNTFSAYGQMLQLDEIEEMIPQILDRLRIAGIVTAVSDPKDENDYPGYQIVAGSLVWKARDGQESYLDPISIPNPPKDLSKPNSYFVDFYRNLAQRLKGLEAREHTAQVPSEERQRREDAFKEADLPILFCSPTMELGIDIKQLNLVNLRNIPPTPANYAQRSGRAGRSGQPALVFSYCTLGSPHDQYFFRNPQDMVAGAVTTPRLELGNEDLVRAHIHSVWLTESQLRLGSSLNGILDLKGSPPPLVVEKELWDDINDKDKLNAAKKGARQLLDALTEDLAESDWYDEHWLEEILNNLPNSFNQACERWRTMHRSSYQQAQRQHDIIHDATRSSEEKKQARRLRDDAESQLRLLENVDNRKLAQSDFYTYRYFASEGFLPGYNFPRLPLSAFIPGRRIKNKESEFLSRSRFLAITEFGPRSIIYHEGSRYRINRVILPIRSDDSDEVTTGSVKICAHCGYLHHVADDMVYDNCESCDSELPKEFKNMFRLQNVITTRVERINSDEEERLRMGYEVRTVLRYAQRAGRTLKRTARIEVNGETFGTLAYGQAANLWRINFGENRRKNKDQLGYMLDTERGFWQKSQNEQEENDAADSDPMSNSIARVIPYVEDHRNCLIIDLSEEISNERMASFEAAFKKAIQVTFQLEDQELASEPLPTKAERKRLLLYEASEGGAGVLRQLIDNPKSLAKVARKMLEICHYDPDSFKDLGRHAHDGEGCDAACYDCLLSYFNQPDHDDLDRTSILSLMSDLSQSEVVGASAETSRGNQLEELVASLPDNDLLARKWLYHLEERGLRLPSHARMPLLNGTITPDFLYENYHLAVFLGAQEDAEKIDEALFEIGITALFFESEADWAEKIDSQKTAFYCDA
ncbi:MAG: DEAD/DEAH box helicase [Verrucomicrobia bacterium]|jgi:ATP-dependent helicase YprA (DUF1998 family)|nr:DEAD/DEAH box helicase [Verrucomicrobiota bacterium]